MYYTQRLIIEDRRTNKRLNERVIEPGAAGNPLLESMLARYADRARYRVYWATDCYWGRN